MSLPPGQATAPGPTRPHSLDNAYPPQPMPGAFFPPPGQPGFQASPPGSIPPGYVAPTGSIPPYGMAPPPYGAVPPPGVGVPAGAVYPGVPGGPYVPPPGGIPAGYPGAAAYPYPNMPGVHKSSGNESDDSQPGDPGLRSKGSNKRIKCTFVNNSGKKVRLFMIDDKGKMRKVAKLKDGKKQVIDTFEGDVYLARRKKRRGHTFVINNNVLYAVAAENDGDDRVKAVILRGPDCVGDLQSEKDGPEKVAVKVKFVNRAKKTAQLVWINPKGKREKIKAVAPGKCYTTTAFECHCWIAHDVQNPDEEMHLNYAFFYSPWKTRKGKERVLITQHKPWNDSSSSSSSDSD